MKFISFQQQLNAMSIRIAQKLLTAFSKFDESSWGHSVWKLQKKSAALASFETFQIWFSPPFERFDYHCQKTCNRMQGLQSQEALFWIEKRASRKWLAQSFWIWWMTSLLQKCQAMIMQSKVNNIKRKMVNCRNYSIVVSREMHWLLFW